MNIFRNLLPILLLLSTLGSSFSQTFTYDYQPLIDIEVTDFDSSIVDLSWNTPPGAVTCTLKYETPFDTALYPITNFSQDSITIARSTPVTPIERFTIYFTKANGRGLYDHGPGGVYGGVIIIEDDVWAASVQLACSLIETTYPEYGDYLFGISSGPDGENMIDIAAVSIPHLCEVLDKIIRENPSELTMEELTYLLELEVLSQLGDPAYEGLVFPYDYIDHYDIQLTLEDLTARIGKTRVSESISYTLAPNPAEHFVMLKPIGTVKDCLVTVKVLDPIGREVYHAGHDFSSSQPSLRIELSDWKSGLYFVQISQEGRRESMKLIKH